MTTTNGVPAVAEMAGKTMQLENTGKRDTLVASELKYQKLWREKEFFNINAPTLKEEPSSDMNEIRRRHPKYYGTMAYPYMNGTLHVGHAFTLSKIEFQTGYQRLLGKRALFPLGFHCSGMPIKACADKLVREIEIFGKDFAGMSEEVVDQSQPKEVIEKSEDVTKFKAKKSKAASKAVAVKYQAQIMEMLGIPLQEIHKFADPYHWLEFFPPLCQQHCESLGTRTDWRRSFITTDANPYYDAFVRWQIRKLKSMEKIKFGKRYTIFSPKDDQPCMDHDRSQGEAVGPQDYTGIKIRLLEWAPKARSILEPIENLKGKSIFFLAATLRPETMYGQTCCFVGPNIEYGIFETTVAGELYLCTSRAARNLAYQELSHERGVVKQLAKVNGKDLIGSKIRAPLSVYPELRILPMDTVLASKGTGVVTCVPSDSPDDYATILELTKKPAYYGIEKEWIELDIVPILETSTYGNLTAKNLYESMKIQSPKDTQKLAEAKDLAYREGFYQGVMLIGKYKGEKVETAKPRVRADLIEEGSAVAYNEPERLVISRSADECVVALCDQWYLDYGEKSWLSKAYEFVAQCNMYQPEVRRAFEASLAWLKQWACARSYGLGTKLPWDTQYLVEGLSDSTIYMSYYTIAHFLHSSIDGKKPGFLNISPDQMTDDVWDYLFINGDLPQTKISTTALETMRREFRYFYPLDVRISAKDLIPNHLTFFIYVHAAIFPKEYWPKSIRVNGHILLNGEKMSKSTGNFLSLQEAVKKFGADAARIALADAGDTMEDPNFEEATANSSILRLFTLREWCDEVLKEDLRVGDMNFFDRAFDNEMNSLVHETKAAYDSTFYKMALKSGFYDLLISRDWYRQATVDNGINMHKQLVMKYIEIQALLLAPIAPHWSDYTWMEVLHKQTSVQNAGFPPLVALDASITDALAYVRDLCTSIRRGEGLAEKKQKKGKANAGSYDSTKPKTLILYVAQTFPSWQDDCLRVLEESFDGLTVDNSKIAPKIASLGHGKKAMPFVKLLQQRMVEYSLTPKELLNRKLLYSEGDTLRSCLVYLKKSLGFADITVVVLDEQRKSGRVLQSAEDASIPPSAESSEPGSPHFQFQNMERA